MNTTPLPLVRHYKDLTWLEAIPGERVTIRVHASDVSGKFSIVENVAQDGTAAPMHTHREDELFHILEGEVLFAVNGEISTLTEGSEILIPAGVPHAWRNKSGKPARMIAIFSPGGIETMFQKLAGLDLPEIVELAAQYGTVLVGPPIEG